MRKASLIDVQHLVTMMAEFYADSPCTLNLRRATQAFASLLADERLGHVWLIQADSEDVGYVVVTLCYGMTYGGLSAIVDDFFIRPVFRGAGRGKAAMEEVRSFYANRGVRAIRVETGRDNAPALAVYRSTGFVDTYLVHLTLGLAEPTHAPWRIDMRTAVHRTCRSPRCSACPDNRKQEFRLRAWARPRLTATDDHPRR